ncbi:MAG TPA: hypothetical protein VF681_02930 [Abditibacteriaceae bacterium]|jgi:hypothetical protein
MQLLHAQRRAILEDGYVHLPGVVPRAMVDAALRAINASVGEGLPPEDLPILSAQSYCPEVRETPVITGLFNDTPVRSLLSSVLGVEAPAAVRGQIALRFPSMRDPLPAPGPHLDGIPTSTNGVPAGELYSFTSLVAVFLSDTPAPGMGNFTVWPGSHNRYAEYLGEHGPEGLIKGKMPVEVGEPRAILAQAGDAAICHYGLGHGIWPNGSPHTRYAVFFRVHHPKHQEEKWEVLSDIWRHWPGIREVAESN